MMICWCLKDQQPVLSLPTRYLTKPGIIISGDLNLPHADWKGDAEKASGFQAIVNNLVWDSGYTQAVSGPTRQDALLDIYIYLLRPESSLIYVNKRSHEHKFSLSLVIVCPQSATIRGSIGSRMGRNLSGAKS